VRTGGKRVDWRKRPRIENLMFNFGITSLKLIAHRPGWPTWLTGFWAVRFRDGQTGLFMYIPPRPAEE
jgi:hypothetical protein